MSEIDRLRQFVKEEYTVLLNDDPIIAESDPANGILEFLNTIYKKRGTPNNIREYGNDYILGSKDRVELPARPFSFSFDNSLHYKGPAIDGSSLPFFNQTAQSFFAPPFPNNIPSNYSKSSNNNIFLQSGNSTPEEGNKFNTSFSQSSVNAPAVGNAFNPFLENFKFSSQANIFEDFNKQKINIPNATPIPNSSLFPPFQPGSSIQPKKDSLTIDKNKFFHSNNDKSASGFFDNPNDITSSSFSTIKEQIREAIIDRMYFSLNSITIIIDEKKNNPPTHMFLWNMTSKIENLYYNIFNRHISIGSFQMFETIFTEIINWYRNSYIPKELRSNESKPNTIDNANMELIDAYHHAIYNIEANRTGSNSTRDYNMTKDEIELIYRAINNINDDLEIDLSRDQLIDNIILYYNNDYIPKNIRSMSNDKLIGSTIHFNSFSQDQNSTEWGFNISNNLNIFKSVPVIPSTLSIVTSLPNAPVSPSKTKNGTGIINNWSNDIVSDNSGTISSPLLKTQNRPIDVTAINGLQTIGSAAANAMSRSAPSSPNYLRKKLEREIMDNPDFDYSQLDKMDDEDNEEYNYDSDQEDFDDEEYEEYA